jgi:cytochrome P450
VHSAVHYPGSNLWAIRPSRRNRERESPLEFLESLARRGDFAPFMVGRQPAVLLNRPDYVVSVLVSSAAAFQKGSANRRAKHLLGDGLLTADSALNAERRRLIQPSFARARLHECADLIVNRTQRMCGDWRNGDVVVVTDAIGRLTFGIVGEAIVGCSVDSDFGEVSDAVSRATASLDPLLSLVAPLRRVRPVQQQLRRAVENLVARASSRATHGSMLALLNAHDEACSSADQRIDDVLTILLAGHDTITSAVTWTLALLSAHPDVERKLHQELDVVLGNRAATASDLPALVYARAILSESLRLYPPAWVLARHAVEPHCFDGNEVRAGTIVLVSQYLLHRDDRFFDRPRVFEPDRWLVTGGPTHPRYAYFPFGAGTRSCIGESFGWLEGVLLLATIGQRWRLRSIDGALPGIDARITLRPRGRVLMRAEARQRERDRRGSAM